MIGIGRGSMTVGLCLALGVVCGCATGGGGGGGGGGGRPPGTVDFAVETGAAGTVAVAANQPVESVIPAALDGQAPANVISGTVSVEADVVDFGEPGADRQAEIAIHIAPADAEDPCADEFKVLDFTATEDGNGVITLTGTTSANLTGDILTAVAQNRFVFCLVIVADFNGTVTVRVVNITLTGAVSGGDGDFFTCTSPGGQDDLVDFGTPGMAQVIASTLGEGRHLLLDPEWDLIYEFSQPVRFCAVIPEHFELIDADTGEEIPIPAENLSHRHIVEGNVVVRSQVLIRPPDSLAAGGDYQLTLSARGLSLDGEFQENSGTNLAANGTLPSGDDQPGGDFVQLFRAVGLTAFLTGTPAAGGIDLDEQGRLYVVGNNGLFGPFDAPAEVTDGSRLGGNLPTLSNRNVVVTESGTLIVKEDNSNGNIFEVDPVTGLATQVAVAGDLTINPDASVRAPQGYSSIELAGVEQGDIVFADASGISALDLPAQTGLKGGVHLVQRVNQISSAYVNLWRPPVRSGRAGEIWGGHKPEDADDGFEIHRILPNGLVDRYVIPRQLFGFEGTAASHLQDVQGRTEFLILGDVTVPALLGTKQVIPDGFDTVGAYVFDAARNRMQLVAPLPLDTYAFTFDAFSQVKLTSDYDRAYISMPSLNAVFAMDGLANANAAGDWPCSDSYYDGDGALDAVDLASGARVVASSFGLGRFLLEGAPTVVEFEFDRLLPHCWFTADNVSLIDLDDPAEAEITLEDRDVKRIPIYDGLNRVACRAMIDLPPELSAGRRYQLTLSGDGFSLDGEFNGTLPSGDGAPGGDFVQTFVLIEGSLFLSETDNAAGIAIDDQGRLFVSNETELFGPFAGPTEVTPAFTLGEVPMLSGGGRPITFAPGDQLIAVGRNNGTIQSLDPFTGAVTEIASQIGGTFEINVVVAPTGYDGPNVASGDLVVLNEGRGTVPDLVAGNTAAQLFSDPSVSDGYMNFFVPPTDLFGPALYGGHRASDVLRNFTVREITPDGQQVELFPALDGVDGRGGIRLPDNMGNPVFLILADFEQLDSPQLPTRQIRGSTEGLEVLIYDAGADLLQVIGALSRGEENAPALLTVDAEVDFAFTPDLDNVYVTQPVARTVVELTGFAE